MEFIFDTPLYREARESRLRNLTRHLDLGSLAGKRILELGCGTGEFGAAFENAGCHVVSVDAGPEYIDELRRRYPGRAAHVMDVEHFDAAPLGQFDAVFCFGLLYHLAEPAKFLAVCAQAAPELYLETAVTDSDSAICPLVAEAGPDQAWSGAGCRPSLAWISQTLAELGFEVRDISTAEANWGGSTPSVFDWPPRNDGEWQREGAFLRKMLICRRVSAAGG